MFRKRAVVIDVVKKKDALVPVEEEQEKISAAAHASVLIDHVVLGGITLIGAYFLADTLRSCAIHTAVTKITPAIVVEAAKK